MSIASHTENETVREWRERLPEVPLAVPEAGDTFKKALPRALAIGVAVAVLVNIVWLGIVAAFHSVYLFLEKTPDDLEPLWLFIPLGMGLFIAILFSMMLSFYFCVAVAVSALAGYGRLTHLYANHPVAMGIGVVFAGSGMGVMGMMLYLWARDFGLVPTGTNGGEWNPTFVSIIKVVALILTLQWGATSLLHPYFCRRRYCPDGGSLFMRRKKVSLSASAAEQIAAAARSDAHLISPELLKTIANESPNTVKLTLLVYECEGCAARLVEGTIFVKYSERKKDGDATWRWLSTVIPREQGAALEASLPKVSAWDRLLFRR